MSHTSELERKLDLLIALTRVGIREELSRELKALEADPVLVSVLQNAQDWTSAGELKSRVKASTSQSEPTIKRRIADLVSRGALQRRGAGGAVSYRATGLFEI